MTKKTKKNLEKKIERIEMENNNHKSGNGFFSGFVFGLLVGGLVVFLLATKKGKKVLKAISEEGLDKVSDILEKTERKADLEEVYEEEEELTLPKRKIVHREEVEVKPRRFFRGISRRLN
jgi:uncharacterized membrane protein YgaE (UPF0421/DUF939 family)